MLKAKSIYLAYLILPVSQSPHGQDYSLSHWIIVFRPQLEWTIDYIQLASDEMETICLLLMCEIIYT